MRNNQEMSLIIEMRASTEGHRYKMYGDLGHQVEHRMEHRL